MQVVHVIAGLGDGGAESVLFRLCTAGKEDRHTVVSLSGDGKYGPMLRQQGITVESLGMPRGRMTLKGLARLYRILREGRPDVVQTWMYHADLVGGVVARLAGIGNVCWNVRHTDLAAAATRRSTRLVAWACARLSGMVPRRIIACAASARDVHVRFGYAASKFVVIANGYDVAVMSPDDDLRGATRREFKVGDAVPLVGFVGRWAAEKDHPHLLAALPAVRERHPLVRLVLVGDGCSPDNAALSSAIAELGLKEAVTLLGRRPDIAAIMNALDLHVLPSRSEAFPNVVAEAMACGTPCVVTDVGDAALIVGDAGWVVPPSDPERLAAAISKALDQRGNATAWSARARRGRRRIVEQFSLAAMVARYREVWSAGIANRRRDRGESGA